MRGRDNKWTVRVIEWQPKDGKRRQGRQRTKMRHEIRSFVGATRQTDTQTSERIEWRQLGRHLYCSGSIDCCCCC